MELKTPLKSVNLEVLPRTVTNTLESGALYIYMNST